MGDVKTLHADLGIEIGCFLSLTCDFVFDGFLAFTCLTNNQIKNKITSKGQRTRVSCPVCLFHLIPVHDSGLEVVVAAAAAAAVAAAGAAAAAVAFGIGFDWGLNSYITFLPLINTRKLQACGCGVPFWPQE